MKSAWFHDALDGQGGRIGHKVEAVFHPDSHRYLLPPLSIETEAMDLTWFIKCVVENLGKAGHAALKQYLVDCKLADNDQALSAMEEAFADVKADVVPARGKRRND
jgi:hypothetical protein